MLLTTLTSSEKVRTYIRSIDPSDRGEQVVDDVDSPEAKTGTRIGPKIHGKPTGVFSAYVTDFRVTKWGDRQVFDSIRGMAASQISDLTLTHSRGASADQHWGSPLRTEPVVTA